MIYQHQLCDRLSPAISCSGITGVVGAQELGNLPEVLQPVNADGCVIEAVSVDQHPRCVLRDACQICKVLLLHGTPRQGPRCSIQLAIDTRAPAGVLPDDALGALVKFLHLQNSFLHRTPCYHLL